MKQVFDGGFIICPGLLLLKGLLLVVGQLGRRGLCNSGLPMEKSTDGLANSSIGSPEYSHGTGWGHNMEGGWNTGLVLLPLIRNLIFTYDCLRMGS